MSQKHLIKTSLAIKEKMFHLFDCGKVGSADENFATLMNSLQDIISTEEAKGEAKEIINGIIEEMNSFVGLGIYIGGEFKPISVAMSARTGLKPGRYISGKRFLVLRKDNYDCLPESAIIDPTSNSIVHKRYMYRRNTDMLSDISREEADNLGLLKIKEALQC